MKDKKVFGGMLWRFGERISAQLVSFIVSVILARILLPAEYGTIAVTMVFITVCNVFVTSGFGSALVQKENADDLDFSTILLFGLFISCLLYGMLFFLAPVIADYYGDPVLAAVLRVMSLKLPFAAVSSVQQAFVSRKMAFKKLFLSTLISTAVSAAVGIAMAYRGYGVWALAAQFLAGGVMDAAALGIIIRWRPRLRFSMERLKSMVGFGWRILCSDLINTIYDEARNLIIGKRYSAEQLAFHNRGRQIPHLFVSNVGVALASVLFPAMVQEQADKAQLRAMVSRTISVGTYMMFPIMTGLIVTAGPLVELLLTDKWLPAVHFLRLACISYAVEPWSTANLQAIKAQGQGRRYLLLEIRKKSVAAGILALSIPFGVYALAASASVYSFIAIALTARENKSGIGYGFFSQLKDVLPNAGLSIAMGLAAGLVSVFRFSAVWTLVLQLGIGTAVYLCLSAAVKNPNYFFVRQLVKGYLRGGRTTNQ